MPRPLKFHTQKPAGGRKASPGGEAGSPQGLTDEVEAKNYHHKLVRRCYLLPHPVRLEPDHRSRGMTATGSHIDFGFAARSTTLQGKAFLCPGRVSADFSHSNAVTERIGACRRPYIAPPGDFRFSLFPLLFSLKRTPRKIQEVRFSCHSIQTVVSTGSPWTYLWSQSSSKSRERRSMGHPRARSSARIRNSGAGSRHSR